MKETASPRFFVELHPESTNKKQMAGILTVELCKEDTTGEEEYKKWMEKHKPNWKEEYIPIPKFHLNTTMHQFGNGVGRVASTVLAMECAAEDAGYLKMLLNKLYMGGKPQYGIFIPTGYHLVTSADKFKAALRKQNTFCSQ
eukprot:7312808-Ditylum_brightwellii.AAC.1